MLVALLEEVHYTLKNEASTYSHTHRRALEQNSHTLIDSHTGCLDCGLLTELRFELCN